MDEMEVKRLALSLSVAESESNVICILKEYNLWDEKHWLPFGDNENNFSIIGTQQSSADAALVEKLVNSVDAVLIRKCLENGIHPESNDAPQSIKEALEQFFHVPDGNISHLKPTDRTELSKNIQLIATGRKSNPNYIVADFGEGQSPKRMKDTILSLSKSNKLRIPFVQGKFNMGGTGVLQFCGINNFQLIISKRSPKIYESFPPAEREVDPTKDKWSLTIVRREEPKQGRKSSIYTYLAPNGDILGFKSNDLSILPNEKMEWGTFIKLFEYKLPGLITVATLNLYYRLSLLLPDIALPVRITETRDYKGHSLSTTLSGLNIRLEDDRNKNLEEGFPYRSFITVEGQRLYYAIYAFKEDKSDHYRKNEGVIFVINGQTHGDIPKTIYTRKSVGLGYISNSLLTILDCSDLDLRSREDLFMNSRDKLRNVELKKTIEQTLEDDFKKNQLLKELQQRRRQESIKNKLGDAKPLADMLNNIIKKSPSLSKILNIGGKVSNPFNLTSGGGKEYNGKFYPTYFSLKKKKKGVPYTKVTPINRRARVFFETDVENNFFGRENDPGELKLYVNDVEVKNYSVNLYNGTATLNITLPKSCKVGDAFKYSIIVDDSTRYEPFIDQFLITVDTKAKDTNSPPSRRATPSGDGNGNRKKPNTLSPPEVYEIHHDEWGKYSMEKDGALRITEAGEGVYDFYVNVDNIHLLTEVKNSRDVEHAKVLTAQYKYGMALVGLSMIHYYDNLEGEEIDVSEKVYECTKMISPTLIPMINSLSDLSEEG
jgi:hypothetical protein